jgi:hypothetical protein
MSSFPQVVLCIATAGKSGVLMRAWLEGLIILLHQSPAILASSIFHISPTETVFFARAHNWLNATWCFSIATQFGTTLMIGCRFWKSIRWNSTRNSICKSRLDVLWIPVESGALYSVTMIFLLGFSATNTGATFVVSLKQISVTVRCSVVPFLDYFVLLKGGG